MVLVTLVGEQLAVEGTRIYLPWVEQRMQKLSTENRLF